MDNVSEMIMINAALEHNGTTSRGGHRPHPYLRGSVRDNFSEPKQPPQPA
jgi:hypothetical protein